MAASGLPPSNARAALARAASERAASSVASAAKWISARTAFEAGSFCACGGSWPSILEASITSPESARYRARSRRASRLAGSEVASFRSCVDGAGVVAVLGELARGDVLGGGVARQVRFEERAHPRQRLGAQEFVDHAAVAKQFDGRNAADLKLLREILVLVGVHLDDLDLAGVFVGHLFEHRPERATGPAPRRPEVDQHGLRGGGVDDLRRETGRGDGRDG